VELVKIQLRTRFDKFPIHLSQGLKQINKKIKINKQTQIEEKEITRVISVFLSSIFSFFQICVAICCLF